MSCGTTMNLRRIEIHSLEIMSFDGTDSNEYRRSTVSDTLITFPCSNILDHLLHSPGNNQCVGVSPPCLLFLSYLLVNLLHGRVRPNMANDKYIIHHKKLNRKANVKIGMGIQIRYDIRCPCQGLMFLDIFKGLHPIV